jgi:hypothetical protein
MTKETQKSGQVDFTAYAVNERNGETYWTPIGAAFAHKNGDGYSIMLSALPVNGRIVLRPGKSDDETKA